MARLLRWAPGLPPVEAAREALRMALAAMTQRIDQPNGVAMAWYESRETRNRARQFTQRPSRFSLPVLRLIQCASLWRAT